MHHPSKTPTRINVAVGSTAVDCAVECKWLEQVMEGITCDHDREAAVVIEQRVNITTVQCDIAQTAVRGRFTGFFEHGRGQVDTRRLAHMRCEGANHNIG